MNIYERIKHREEKLPVKQSKSEDAAPQEEGSAEASSGAPVAPNTASANADTAQTSTERQLSLGAEKKTELTDKERAAIDYALRVAEMYKLAKKIDHNFGEGLHADATHLQGKLMAASASLGVDLSGDVSTQLYVDRNPSYTVYKIEHDGGFSSFDGDLPGAPSQTPVMQQLQAPTKSLA